MDFTALVTEIFEQIEAEFRAARVKANREYSQRAFDAWKQRLNGPMPEHLPDGPVYSRDRPTRDAMARPQYVIAKPGSRDYFVSLDAQWAGLRDDINAGLYLPDPDRAERDAHVEVDSVKAQFIAKQSRKLNNATQLCAGRPKVDGRLEYRAGRMGGRMTVDYGNGNSFALEMSVVHNYRSSRYGHGTSFYQYPARFTAVKINGEKPKATISEAWMAENFKA